jgi:hypothetical protein
MHRHDPWCSGAKSTRSLSTQEISAAMSNHDKRFYDEVFLHHRNTYLIGAFVFSENR